MIRTWNLWKAHYFHSKSTQKQEVGGRIIYIHSDDVIYLEFKTL